MKRVSHFWGDVFDDVKSWKSGLFILCCLLAGTTWAQVNTGGNGRTSDHQKEVIGYVSNWDAWKATSAGVPSAGALTHLNLDYSKYTILNYSFFGVAGDGSLHSGDLRNKNINQPGVSQEPGDIFFTDVYSSWDMFLLFGEIDPIQYVSADVQQRAKAQGFEVEVGGATWTHPAWGLSGGLPLPLQKEGGALGILDLAHQNGVKVMASIGGWSMSKHFSEMAADPTKKARFIEDCKKLIATGFDGIDLDWEYPGPFPGMNFTGVEADFANFASLVEDIRAAIGSDKLITAAMAAAPAKLQGFDWPRLARSMDYFNMMTYDFAGGFSSKANHNAPIYDYPESEYKGFSWEATLATLKAQGVPSNKINFGMPFYGRGVITDGAADLGKATVKRQDNVQPDGQISTASDFVNWPRDVYDGTPNYFFIKQKALGGQNGWTRKWDDQAKVPYLVKDNYFLSYDDEESIGYKAQYINDNNLAGTIIWTTYGDLEFGGSVTNFGNKLKRWSDVKSPLVNKINEVFAKGGGGGGDDGDKNKAPSVAISSPAGGATFTAGADVAVTVNAADADGTVASVELFNNGQSVGVDRTTPFTFTVASAPAGAYTLSAKATDDDGAVATSSSVNITVGDDGGDGGGGGGGGGGGDCDGIAAWSNGTVYTGGDRATAGGVVYEAKWWTNGDNPANNSGPAGVWANVADCGGGGDGDGGGGTGDNPGDDNGGGDCPDAFKVVGYMPSWQGTADAIQYDKLTHINYSFLIPNGDGSLRPLENASKMQQIVTKGHAQGVKVLIAVGGWLDGNDAPFIQLAANAGTRTAFVNNLVRFVDQNDLDGVDMDWEYPREGNEPQNYESLMKELGRALHAKGKLLTAAVVVAGYNADGILRGVFDDVDFLNIMAYDGPDHSGMAQAEGGLNYWLGRGLPKEKAVLGVPFYSRPQVLSYAGLLAAGADKNSDSFNGTNYNGIPTIKAKTELAQQRGGGIMIWELSNDTSDPQTSLLAAINAVAGDPCDDGGDPNPPTCVADGGTLGGGPFEFVIDGEADYVSGITLAGATGANSTYVITDENAKILGLPATLAQVEAENFDGAGAGVCLIWHLSFEDGLQNAAVGNNASELEGCFDLSNSIKVTRTQGDPPSGCEADGGAITGGPFEFTIDGAADNVSGIALAGNSGTNSTWVVTDDRANILGLPGTLADLEGVNFDDAGAGTCLIWHLSFEDGLQNAAVGNNASELAGCFDLSNSITVTRVEDNTGGDGGGGGDCDGLPAWVNGTVYVSGDRVSYEGKAYEAKWWTNSENPARSGSFGVWKLITDCGGGDGGGGGDTNNAPTVSISSPAGGSSFATGDNVGVTVAASDSDGSVVSVEIFNNGQSVAVDSDAPYTYTVENAPAGNYTLTATATDDDGASTTSAGVSISVADGDGGGGGGGGGGDGGGDPSIPGKILVGYWHNFNNGSTTPRLSEVSDKWDVVNIAFAEPTVGSSSNMVFSPYEIYGGNTQAFISEVAALKAKGKKVLISIGGANARVELNTPGERDEFVRSMTSIINTYGFNGLDIDLEGNSVALGGGDNDYKNPTTPKIRYLIEATKTIRNNIGADRFILTMAPETAFVQGGASAYAGVFGAYLPVIHGLRKEMDYIHVQHYNTGSMLGRDGKAYSSGNADFHAAMLEMMITGFDMANGQFFDGLRADQVAIGLPATQRAAGSGYTPERIVQQALDYLIKGQGFGGSYKRLGTYPAIRGIMTWSINWDLASGEQFSNSHRAYLNGVSNAAPLAGRSGEDLQAAVSAYPNPVTADVIQLSINPAALLAAEQLEVEIFSTDGRQVIDYTVEDLEHSSGVEAVDISALPSGLYYYTATMASGEYTGKFVRQ